MLLFSRVAPVGAFETGQVLHNGNPDNGALVCSECHSGEPSPAAIEITGPAQVEAGSTAIFEVTLQGGPGIVGGLNVSTSGHLGILAPIDADTRLFFDEITHTEAKPFRDGDVRFEFSWTAPDDPQPITMYVAGVSGDGNGRNNGDSIASSTFAVEVTNLDAGPVNGDVNGDGGIDRADVQALLDMLTGQVVDGFDQAAADLNGDTSVGLLDALLLAQLVSR